MTVKLANGQNIVVRNQTNTLQVAIETLWGPAVVVSTAFVVIARIDTFYFSGRRGGARSGEMPDDVGSRCEISLHCITVTLKSMQAADKVASVMELRVEFVEDMDVQGPAMFMEVGNEAIARRGALMASVDAALKAGLPSDAETRLRELLIGPMFDEFRRSSSGYPPARVEPFQVKLKADADLSKVKARPRVYFPGKTA